MNEKDGSKETALIVASREGHATIVDLLLRAGGNAFECNAKGEDAITVAKSANLKSHIK